jgi:hypothetical protein
MKRAYMSIADAYSIMGNADNAEIYFQAKKINPFIKEDR